MSDPSIGALNASATPPLSQEPISSESPPAAPSACVDPSVSPADGPRGAGTEALVQRFGGGEGTSGTGDVPAMPEGGTSCSDDALRAAGTCGAAVLVASATGGWGAIAGSIACAGALEGYIECVANEQRAAKP